MTRKPVSDVAASVRQRLLNAARKEGTDFQRLLVRYAVERLLYRLSRSPMRDRFILKGAMLFTTWTDAPFRATGDLDLLGVGDNDVATAAAFFTGLCATDGAGDDDHHADGLLFDADSVGVEPMREEDQYPGLRVKLEARLKTTRIPVQIDIGYGDAVHPQPLDIAFPTLLLELPAASIRAYPPETVVAEKFEAMVRFDALTGRLKDHYDLWAISCTFPFKRAELAAAISKTFERRKTALPADWPGCLTADFAARADKLAQWNAFLTRTQPTLVPPSFPDLLEALRRFLMPVGLSATNAAAAAGDWSPNKGWG